MVAEGNVYKGKCIEDEEGPFLWPRLCYGAIEIVLLLLLLLLLLCNCNLVLVEAKADGVPALNGNRELLLLYSQLNGRALLELNHWKE